MNKQEQKVPEWIEKLEAEGEQTYLQNAVPEGYARKKLIKWSIRQALTIALVYWLWDKPWINILIWIWIPIAILNLILILFFNKIMLWRLRKFRAKVDEIKKEHTN